MKTTIKEWNKQAIKRKCLAFGQLGLYAYLIMVFGVIILFIINPTNYSYQLENPALNSIDLSKINFNITNNSYNNEKESNIRTISTSEYIKQKNRMTIMVISSIIGIIGITILNPKKMAKIKKIRGYINELNK